MRLTGLPVIYDIDPFSTSTTQQLPFGAIGYDSIGRQYRYSKVGAVALVGGNLLQSPARDTAFTDMAVPAAVVIGATSIGITLGGTSTTANLFDLGTLSITAGTGIGQTLTVKSHSVSTNGTTATFNTWEGLLVALTTSSKITANPNLYNGVIVSPTARTGKTVGVAMTAAAIGAFTWIGTKGCFGVLSDATVAAVGEGLSPSTSTAGCVTKAVTLLERIGTAALLGISAKTEQVILDCP